MDRAEIDLILESKPRKFHRNNLVKGVGKNDSPFCTGAEFNGKVINHRAYDIWCGMLQRTTCPSFQKAHQHYKGCSVCEEWLTFTNFFSWWKKNHVDGWELDKDFTVIGNKVYSPETCIFIPSQLNSFINAKVKHSSELPVGAMYVPSLSKFKSVINFMRQYHYLWLFETAEDAHLAWITKKITFAYEFKETCNLISPRLFDVLLTRVLALSSAPTKYEIAERIAEEIETAEHLKRLRAMRAA